MKKRLYLITTFLLSATVLSLSSCLKDSRYIDFSKVGTLVEFPFGGTPNFGADAITETPDSDAKGTIVRQFAVNIASPTVPTSATTVTLEIDNSLIAAYNATESAVNYIQMPDNAFSFTATTVTVPAGQRSAIVSVTFYKNLLDASNSYMLPIRISKASQGTISGNFGIHYFHFIGNDFAGSFEHYYSRWETPDTTTSPSSNRVDEGPITIYPITPSELNVITNYYTQPNYDITFVKTGTGASATYSQWAVQFLPGDVTDNQWSDNITVVQQPKFAPKKIKFDANTEYTYAQSLLLFRIYFTTASRGIIDEYDKN